MPEKVEAFDFSRELNELNRRVRMIEIKNEKLEERILAIEKRIEGLQTDLKIYSDLSSKKVEDIKQQIIQIKEEMENLKKNIDQLATKTELQKIKFFLDLFNPLTSNFVTKEEMERKIEEIKSVLKQENK
jgi:predicted  nucleic acid-binding Zn-ribbon protein